MFWLRCRQQQQREDLCITTSSYFKIEMYCAFTIYTFYYTIYTFYGYQKKKINQIKMSCMTKRRTACGVVSPLSGRGGGYQGHPPPPDLDQGWPCRPEPGIPIWILTKGYPLPPSPTLPLAGWPRHRENREFGSYFFQTGKTQGILL